MIVLSVFGFGHRGRARAAKRMRHGPGWLVLCAGLAGTALAAGDPSGFDPPQETAAGDCAGVGSGYTRLADTGVCLRVTGEITASTDRAVGDGVLLLESGYTDDGAPAVDYVAAPRAGAGEELRGTLEAELGAVAVTRTDLGPLTTEVRLRGVVEGADSQAVEIERAYIRLYPFTAGRRESYFDHLPGYNLRGGYASDTVTNLVALSRDVSESLHLRLSIEDGNARRMEDGQWAQYDAHDLPDLVVAARYLGETRTVHVAGALHRLTDLRPGLHDQERRRGWGFAATASVEQKLDYGAYSGRLLLTGSYADGAIGYLGIPFFATDFIVSPAAGIARTTGYALLASYLHIWSPRLTSALSASYYRTRTRAAPFLWRTEGVLAQVNTEFTPVEGLVLGAELSYARDRLQGTLGAVAGPWEVADDVTATGYMKRHF